MTIRGLISSIIAAASITMGAVQADNITTRDDLFDYLKIGNDNSVGSAETPECKKLMAGDSNPALMGDVQTGNITTRDEWHLLKGTSKN